MIKPITSVRVSGQRVVVRAGFDVPLKKNIQTEEWEVADDARIKDALPTLEYLLEAGARVVIISHLDRPEGWDGDKSLWPAAVTLGELLQVKTVRVEERLPDYAVPQLYFLPADITKHDYSDLTRAMRAGDILFLENLRFYPGEADNNDRFIQVLAKFGDLFVNEAFSVSHRLEASTYGIAWKMPAYAGISFAKELRNLGRILRQPVQPMVVLIGGAKIADKVETINNLARHASHILLGGVLANAFLRAKGYEVGQSKVAEVALARQLARNFQEKLVLPVDVVVAKSIEDLPRCVTVDKILPSDMIFDVGPETIRKFAEYIKTAQTLVWNGPFGMIEVKKYAFGTESLARIFAARSQGRAYGVAGGGETVEAFDAAGASPFVDHMSTGGGAMLEFLAGKKLPAIKALESH